jgi:hypothetical protein
LIFMGHWGMLRANMGNNFRERLSRGESKYVRGAKSRSRQQLAVEEFRRNMQSATDVIKNSCQGVENNEMWRLVVEYWQIRHDFYNKEGTEEYKDKISVFYHKLPSELDLQVSTALRIISANFAKHPGRS